MDNAGIATLPRKYKRCSEAEKARIIADVKERMAECTLAELANEHGISPRTLDYWMAQQPDNDQLRQAWIDSKLIAAQTDLDRIGQAIEVEDAEIQGIVDAIGRITDPEHKKDARVHLKECYARRERLLSLEQLRLARVREQIKSAQWYAERRDRQRYGAQLQVEHEHRHVSFSIVAPAIHGPQAQSGEPALIAEYKPAYIGNDRAQSGEHEADRAMNDGQSGGGGGEEEGRGSHAGGGRVPSSLDCLPQTEDTP